MECLKQYLIGVNNGSKNSASNCLKLVPIGSHEQRMERQSAISNVKKKMYNPLQTSSTILKLLI